RSRFPAMGQMRRMNEAKTIFSGFQTVFVSQTFCWTRGEIVDADHCADHTASRLCVRRDFEPFVKRAAFVGFKMAERNPAQIRRIYHLRDRFTNLRKNRAHSG